MKIACVIFPEVVPAVGTTTIGCWIGNGGWLPIRTHERLESKLSPLFPDVSLSLSGQNLVVSARSAARSPEGVREDANRFAAKVREVGFETLITNLRTTEEVMRVIA